MKRFWQGWGARRTPESPAVDGLYTAIVARGREPHWYLAGGVADTMDGRLDMIMAVLSLVLIRLESDAAGAAPSVALTEMFITDMDAQLRQSGVGDVGIGKSVGQMVSMLGGRIGAYRDGLAGGELRDALMRNLYRGVDPGEAAVAQVAARLAAFASALAEQEIAALLAGALP